MTAIVPQSNALSEATVCRLVADLDVIPDHRERRGRVSPLSSIGDDQGPEDTADFSRDRDTDLLAELQARVDGMGTVLLQVQDQQDFQLLAPGHPPLAAVPTPADARQLPAALG